MTLTAAPFVFSLPKELEATEPPEARGLARDGVRLLISRFRSDEFHHARFRDLPAFLDPGDLLVVNTSATLNAALPARSPDGAPYVLHLSTRLPGGLWAVEVRQQLEKRHETYESARPGDRFDLPAGGRADLLAPLHPGFGRLWITRLSLPLSLDAFLARHGRPIRYNYIRGRWPLDFYQTVFAAEPGSAEMPSAGRAFTPELVTRLVVRGIQFAPLVLHAGVASAETREPPHAEPYRVPPETADQVNLARQRGRRVIAVGTTVVRTLETVADASGEVHPGAGETDLLISPNYPLRAVDGLLTGFHEPEATHLAMLLALAGESHIAVAYQAALAGRYLWHEFGDLHLLLP
ncbi:MAG: S-adenosylmethionine:tRNA ribosyltransferase-isomerase [Chloroflexi bacterium]|nr:S-adenosylmethionine:tRNA ribosyltransferase-isomerase [Chloroflexota bacterium]